MHHSNKLKHLLMLAESDIKMNSWLSLHPITETDFTNRELCTARLLVGSNCSELNIIVNDEQTRFLTNACLYYVDLYYTVGDDEYLSDDEVPDDLNLHYDYTLCIQQDHHITWGEPKSTERRVSTDTNHPEMEQFKKGWDLWKCMDDCWSWMDRSQKLEDLLMLAKSHRKMKSWLSRNPVPTIDLIQDDVFTAHMRVRSYCSAMNIIVNDKQALFLTDACLYYVSLYYTERNEPFLSDDEDPDSDEEHPSEYREGFQYDLNNEKRQTVQRVYPHPQSETSHLQLSAKCEPTSDIEGINQDIDMGRVDQLCPKLTRRERIRFWKSKTQSALAAAHLCLTCLKEEINEGEDQEEVHLSRELEKRTTGVEIGIGLILGLGLGISLLVYRSRNV